MDFWVLKMLFKLPNHLTKWTQSMLGIKGDQFTLQEPKSLIS